MTDYGVQLIIIDIFRADVKKYTYYVKESGRLLHSQRDHHAIPDGFS